MENLTKEIYSKLWAFTRGDFEPKKFESWLNMSKSLETFLGHEFYLTFLETNYGDVEKVNGLRSSLHYWLSNTFPKCPCLKISDKTNFDDNDGYGLPGKELHEKSGFDYYQILKNQNDWVRLCKCKICGQHWCVFSGPDGQDLAFIRLEDDQVDLIRKGQWPKKFDKHVAELKDFK